MIIRITQQHKFVGAVFAKKVCEMILQVLSYKKWTLEMREIFKKNCISESEYNIRTLHRYTLYLCVSLYKVRQKGLVLKIIQFFRILTDCQLYFFAWGCLESWDHEILDLTNDLKWGANVSSHSYLGSFKSSIFLWRINKIFNISIKTLYIPLWWLDL